MELSVANARTAPRTLPMTPVARLAPLVRYFVQTNMERYVNFQVARCVVEILLTVAAAVGLVRAVALVQAVAAAHRSRKRLAILVLKG